MNSQRAIRLLETVAGVLREAGIEATTAPSPRAAQTRQSGQRLAIATAPGAPELSWPVLCRDDVKPSTLAVLSGRLDRQRWPDGQPILIAPHLSETVTTVLRDRNQPYADAAGNAFLRAPGVFVRLTGNRSVRSPRTRAGRLETAAGAKVVFTLLCEPDLAARSQRAIAAASGVALGVVPGVLEALRARGCLGGDGPMRHMTPDRRLLDDWVMTWAARLRPASLRASYRSDHPESWATWPVDMHAQVWGGEAAAKRLGADWKPVRLTLHASTLPARFLIAAGLVQTAGPDDGAHLTVRRPFWNTAHLSFANPRLAPLLAYADLLAEGGDARFAIAEWLFQRHLAGWMRPR
ncbi:MAG: type IV toxin-antitoxin system AbiEi family antitoxin [Pseudomonadales bacterium]|nr:hypothetical protein [Pseudomonadales bacterium]